MPKFYRKRTLSSPAEDLSWLRTARDGLQAVSERSFVAGHWPLRAAQMDRVLKALGMLQHVLHGAITEARLDAGVDSNVKEAEWLGYPPPRR